MRRLSANPSQERRAGRERAEGIVRRGEIDKEPASQANAYYSPLLGYTFNSGGRLGGWVGKQQDHRPTNGPTDCRASPLSP